MIARIQTLNLDDYEEGVEEKVPVTTLINFKLKHVSSFHIITDGEDKYLYTNINGIEYPLIYEPYLEKVLEAEINKEKQ
jgi:hypothetical protein